MFEAKLGNAALLKKIIEAIKDLVTDAPFDCSENAMCLQAMDSSHVALVSMKLEVGLFETYRCDRTINLGMSLANMAKALKCANNDDTCLIRYEENDADSITFAFEDTKRGKMQEVTVKMMDIDNEHLGIPDQDYAAVVTMPSGEFQAMDSSHVALVSMKLEVGLFETYRCDRTINLGMSLANMAKALKCANNDDTCLIRYEENDADSITFAFEDTKRGKMQEVTVKMMDIDNEHLGIPDQDYAAVVTMPSGEFQKTCRDLAMFSDSLTITVTKAGIVFTGKGDTGSSVVNYAPTKNADNDDDDAVLIVVKEPVNVSFSIKYMNHFTKATGLSQKVKISLCNNIPVVIEYGIEENGYLRFYLAPKIDEDENPMDD
ncbi:Proliferating cell nuclear antigen [Toxocara canis]|uniref:DNA sliding clamp PCNA n=1 Tax=Toxocara canis TaxID=6265 RepID=A0A0B2UYH8_TOXCA|nr:Proliferating cell nuclear antigen [Toxocara canis]